MTDLFEQKARDWDANDIRSQMSAAVGEAIKQQIELTDQMEVLDFGAGTGLVSASIAPHVKAITGVDISESMLAKLASKQELQGKVKPVCQDITLQPLAERFDLAVSAMALHHVEDTANLLQTFHAHLKPGGRIALADLDSEDGTFHPPGTDGIFHTGFDRRQLGDLIEQAGFGDVHFVTAHTVNKEHASYPVFLVTARRLD